MLARDHAIEAARQHHDAFNRLVRGLQHFVVVAIDRQVGVHVAVARVHVQRHPHAALEHALVDGGGLVQDGLERSARKNALQWGPQLGLPAGAQGVVLQLREQGGHVLQPARPQRTHLGHQRNSLGHAVFQQFGRWNLVGVVVLAQGQVATLKKIGERVAQLDLVAQTQFDVDALDAVGVLGHARQRNHHVFVDLEGVGVAADGRRALAIQPELLARLGADGDEAFAAARVGNAHHFAGHARHVVGVIARDVTKQHHLRQTTTVLFALGGVTDGLEIAVIQMFQTGQQNAAALLLGEHEVLDFHDGRHRILGIAKELQAHGARVLGHAVHHPARAGDEAIAALFLDTRQARQELVGHVLAQAFLAEGLARDVQAFGAQRRLAVGGEILQLEAGHFGVVDLAQVVVQARHLQPLRLGRHHAPTGQVVQRRAPQHGFLAARVHGDVAANARGLGTGRVHGKHIACALGGIRHALGDHTGFGPHGADFAVHARQTAHLHLGHGFELFGVDDHALPGQRNGAAGVTRAAPTRNDGQAQLDAALDQASHLGLGVGREHHKRVFDAPVGRIGHMAHARKAVKLDVVLGRKAPQRALDLAAQRGGLLERGIEFGHGAARGLCQFAHQAVALGIVGRGAALVDFAQAVLQGIDQQLATRRVVQQVVLQVGVALHHPDVTQHLVQHAGRAAGAALIAQLVEHLPGGRAQQANHDLPVGERGVVIGNFAQTNRLGSLRLQGGQRNRNIHGINLGGRGAPLCLGVGILCHRLRLRRPALSAGAAPKAMNVGSKTKSARSALPASATSYIYRSKLRTARGCAALRAHGPVCRAPGPTTRRRCRSPHSQSSRWSAGTGPRC